jgi:hypothetical protein
MGEVLKFARRQDTDVAPKPKKLRNEKRGYLLVSARVLDAVKEIEECVDKLAPHIPYRMLEAGWSWAAYYRLVAILDGATRYE